MVSHSQGVAEKEVKEEEKKVEGERKDRTK